MLKSAQIVGRKESVRMCRPTENEAGHYWEPETGRRLDESESSRLNKVVAFTPEEKCPRHRGELIRYGDEYFRKVGKELRVVTDW